jgi:hypothetical protein
VLLLELLAAALLLAAPAPPAGGYVSCLDDPESRLTVGSGQRSALRPGTSGELRLQCGRCCWIQEDVPVPVTWSIDPAGAATLDPKSGKFTLSSKAVVGSTLKVIGQLTHAGKKRTAEAEILVIDPRPQPWAGEWKEAERLPCPGAKANPDVPLIQEFVLGEDATFAVTWHPFERYKDYWGTYTVDRETGAIEFKVDGGNHVPSNLDLVGTFEVGTRSGLILRGISLGAPSDVADSVPACGHRFGG